jgi:hypothetical protein
MVSGIHIPWTLVRYIHLPLSTPTERTVRTEQRFDDFSIARLGGVAALNIQCLVYRPSDVAWDITSLHTFTSFYSTSPRSAAAHPLTSGPDSR